jgi:hypothetical protein
MFCYATGKPVSPEFLGVAMLVIGNYFGARGAAVPGKGN